MSQYQLPQINLGSLQVSRLIAGSNPISGFSHAGSERSRAMLDSATASIVKSACRYARLVSTFAKDCNTNASVAPRASTAAIR